MENTEGNRNIPTLRTTNEVVQSFITTAARYDFNVYEKRILYCLVQMVQSSIRKDGLKNPIGKISREFQNNIEMKLFIRNLLIQPGDRKNYGRIKEALESLQHKTFTYDNGNGGWGSISIIANPEIAKGSSEAVFVVNKKIWQILLNISKGFSRYDINVALSLESVYAMRFYEIMYSQPRSITVSIENLRDLFCLQNKYKQPGDLIAKVVDSAKKELDRKSDVSFEWKTNKTGRKITSVTLTPVRTRPALEAEGQTVPSGGGACPEKELRPEVMKQLLHIGFTESGIRNNLGLFLEASRRLSGFPRDLLLLKRESAGKKNPCGWVIEAVRGMLKDLGEERIPV